jgi:hypothetical protein
MIGSWRLATGLEGCFQRILAETRRENRRNARYRPEGDAMAPGLQLEVICRALEPIYCLAANPPAIDRHRQ